MMKNVKTKLVCARAWLKVYLLAMRVRQETDTFRSKLVKDKTNCFELIWAFQELIKICKKNCARNFYPVGTNETKSQIFWAI